MPFDGTEFDSITPVAQQIVNEMSVLLAHESRWVKSQFRRRLNDGGYGYCLMGALTHARAVCRQNDMRSYAVKARIYSAAFQEVKNQMLAIILELPAGRHCYGGVETFNDADQTTHSHIIGLLNDVRTRLANRQLQPVTT